MDNFFYKKIVKLMQDEHILVEAQRHDIDVTEREHCHLLTMLSFMREKTS